MIVLTYAENMRRTGWQKEAQTSDGTPMEGEAPVQHAYYRTLRGSFSFCLSL